MVEAYYSFRCKTISLDLFYLGSDSPVRKPCLKPATEFDCAHLKWLHSYGEISELHEAVNKMVPAEDSSGVSVFQSASLLAGTREAMMLSGSIRMPLILKGIT